MPPPNCLKVDDLTVVGTRLEMKIVWIKLSKLIQRFFDLFVHGGLPLRVNKVIFV